MECGRSYSSVATAFGEARWAVRFRVSAECVDGDARERPKRRSGGGSYGRPEVSLNSSYIRPHVGGVKRARQDPSMNRSERVAQLVLLRVVPLSRHVRTATMWIGVIRSGCQRSARRIHPHFDVAIFSAVGDARWLSLPPSGYGGLRLAAARLNYYDQYREHRSREGHDLSGRDDPRRAFLASRIGVLKPAWTRLARRRPRASAIDFRGYRRLRLGNQSLISIRPSPERRSRARIPQPTSA